MKINAIEEGIFKVRDNGDNLEDNRTMDLSGEGKKTQKRMILENHKGVKVILDRKSVV